MIELVPESTMAVTLLPRTKGATVLLLDIRLILARLIIQKA